MEKALQTARKLGATMTGFHWYYGLFYFETNEKEYIIYEDGEIIQEKDK